MIRPPPVTNRAGARKPRASGDDPMGRCYVERSHLVNPARAGMILSAIMIVASGSV